MHENAPTGRGVLYTCETTALPYTPPRYVGGR